MLFTQLIKGNLNTKLIGNKIEYYQRLDSTNKEAISLIEENLISSGTIILTDHQFDGKGRNKNKWFSSSGKSITFSLFLKPDFPIKKLNLLSLATGLAVANALKKFNFKTNLKWPNDILLKKKKYGGILIESKIHNKKIKYLIIGIGLNVNEDSFDSSIENIATSLFIEKKIPIQRELIIACILNELEVLIDMLNNNNENIKINWTKLCNHINKKVRFLDNKEIKKGIFLGVNQIGEAIIKEENKKIILTKNDNIKILNY